MSCIVHIMILHIALRQHTYNMNPGPAKFRSQSNPGQKEVATASHPGQFMNLLVL